MSKHATLTIKQVQVQAQWTDLGRRFAQIDGFSQSGAVDWCNYSLVNALLGNPLHIPAIEVMHGQFSFSVNQKLTCCVSGASTKLTLLDSTDGSSDKNRAKRTIPLYTPFVLHPGDTLHLGEIQDGLFCFIGFCAQPVITTFRGSVCAVKREQAGGLRGDGIGLKHGDVVKLANIRDTHNIQDVDDNNSHDIGTNAPALLDASILALHSKQGGLIKQLPITFCYQHERFSLRDKTLFLSQQYKVSSQIDRMGLRLKGQALEINKMTLLSQPIAKGAIQISGDGLPIIMRNERQTIGGYPIIATVSAYGLMILSQARPGDIICFVDESLESSQIQFRFLQQALEKLSTKQNTLG